MVTLHFYPFSRYKSIIREFSLGVVSISEPRSFKKKNTVEKMKLPAGLQGMAELETSLIIFFFLYLFL